jgi:hypothetical protein
MQRVQQTPVAFSPPAAALVSSQYASPTFSTKEKQNIPVAMHDRHIAYSCFFGHSLRSRLDLLTPLLSPSPVVSSREK